MHSSRHSLDLACQEAEKDNLEWALPPRELPISIKAAQLVKLSNNAKFFQAQFDQERNQVCKLKNQLIQARKLLNSIGDTFYKRLKQTHTNIAELTVSELCQLFDKDLVTYKKSSEEKQSQILSLKQEFSKSQKEHQQQHLLLQMRVRQESQKLKRKQAQMLQRLQAQASQFAQNKQNIMDQLKSLDKQISKLNNDISKKERALQLRRKELQKLQADMQLQQKRYLEGLQSQKKQNELKIASIEQIHQKMLTKISKQNEQMVTRILQDKEQSLAYIKESYQNQLLNQKLYTAQKESQLQVKNQTIFRLNQRCESVQTRLKQTQAEKQETTACLNSKMSELQTKKQKLIQTRKQLLKTRQNLQQRVQAVQKLKEQLQAEEKQGRFLKFQLNKATIRIDELQHQFSLNNQRKDAIISQIKSLAQRNLEHLKTVHAQELYQLNYKLKDSSNKIIDLESQISNRNEMLKSIGQQHEQVLIQLQSQHKAALDSLTQAHNSQLHQTLLLIQKSKSQFMEMHKQEMAYLRESLTSGFQAEFARLSEQSRVNEQILMAQVQSEKIRREQLESINSQLRAKAQSTYDQLLLKHQQQIQAQRNSYESQFTIMQQEANRREAQLKIRLQVEYEQALSDLKEKHDEELRIQGQHIVKLMEERREQAARMQQEHKRAIRELEQEHQQQVEQLLCKIKRLEDSYEQSSKEIIEKIRLQFQNRIKTMQLQHSQQLSLLQLNHKDAQRQLLDLHELTITRLVQDQQKRLQDVLDGHAIELQDRARSHAKEKEQLSLQYQIERDLAQHKHMIVLRDQENEFASKIEQLASKMDQQIVLISKLLNVQVQKHNETRLTSEQLLQKLDQKISFLKQQITTKQSQNDQLLLSYSSLNKCHQARVEELRSIHQSQLRSKQLQLQKMANEFIQLNQQFRLKLKQYQQNLARRIQEQRQLIFQEFKAQIEQLIQQLRLSRDAQKHLKEQFDNDLLTWKQRYFQLQKTFNGRPARTQDIKEIKRLNQEIQKFNEKMEIAQNKIKNINQVVYYLHLELENYKEMYAIFGSHRPEGLDADSFLNKQAILNNKLEEFHKKQLKQKLQKIASHKFQPNSAVQSKSFVAKTIRRYQKKYSLLKNNTEGAQDNSPKLNLSFMDEGTQQFCSKANIILESIGSKQKSKAVSLRKKDQQRGQVRKLQKIHKVQQKREYYSNLVKQFENHKISVNASRVHSFHS